MNVVGIGVVFARGRGVDSLRDALRTGWMPPERDEESTQGSSLPAYHVSKEALTDKNVLKKTRRADRFTKMAVLAAWDAVQDADLDEGQRENLGIILATGFGPHVTTFSFLDDILVYGESGVSPTLFSHCVHNAAASYIALTLGSQGPAMTLTQFSFSFHQALLLAQAWLREGRCESVLVGSCDVCGSVMEYIFSQKRMIAPDGRIKPFRFLDPPVSLPGEGSAFFLLRRDSAKLGYCEISGVQSNRSAILFSEPDVCLIETDGMFGDERDCLELVPKNVLLAGYAPLFGGTLTGSAFHCAAGALMLKEQILFGSPVLDGPPDHRLSSSMQRIEINRLVSLRAGCHQEVAAVEMRRLEQAATG